MVQLPGRSEGYAFASSVSPGGVPGRVSCVVVHHRGLADLDRCLSSLAGQTDDLEIVVVDNGSSEPVSPRPSVRLVTLPCNLGFGGGVNAGLAVATGAFVLLLNPDAELAPGALAALVEAARDADIVAPRLVLRDQPDRLDNCGHGLYPDGLNWCRGRGEVASGRFERAEDLLLFSGAAVLFRRSALARSGGFDAAYFAYGEDADLGLRAARLGLRCRYEPRAVVHHAVGGSFGRASLRKVFLVERNRLRVAVTHLPRRWLLASPGWTLLRHAALALPSAAGQGIGAGWSVRERVALPFVVAGAQIAALAQLPGSLRRRRALGLLAGSTEAYRAQLDTARIGPRQLVARAAP